MPSTSSRSEPPESLSAAARARLTGGGLFRSRICDGVASSLCPHSGGRSADLPSIRPRTLVGSARPFGHHPPVRMVCVPAPLRSGHVVRRNGHLRGDLCLECRSRVSRIRRSIGTEAGSSRVSFCQWGERNRRAGAPPVRPRLTRPWIGSLRRHARTQTLEPSRRRQTSRRARCCCRRAMGTDRRRRFHRCS